MTLEPNIAMTGDEARIIMNALVNSESPAPTGTTLKLYLKLNQISNVQPHQAEAQPIARPPSKNIKRSRRK